jgi:hypothetical protein
MVLRRILILVSVLACAASAAADIAPSHKKTIPVLLGQWAWKSDKGDCAETYEYLPNGVKFSRSGEEELEKRYIVMEVTPFNATHYFVREVTLKTNGKSDCSGAIAKTGAAAQFYLLKEDGDRFLTCGASDKGSCYGVATRRR